MQKILLWTLLLAAGCQQGWGRRKKDEKSADLPALLNGNCPSSALTFMTFNIHYGKDAGERDTFTYLQEYIRKTSADIVFLQEVDKNTVRSGRREQFALLKAFAAYPYGHFEELIPWNGGTFGIGILSKYPLENLRIIDLDVDDSLKNPEYERRGAIHAQIVVNDQKIHLVNTHWAYTSPWREIQSDILMKALSAELSGTEALVLAGDLNALPHEAVIMNLKSELTDSWDQVATSELPRRIDYIFSKNLPNPCRAVLEDTRLSDHFPYQVQFPLP